MTGAHITAKSAESDLLDRLRAGTTVAVKFSELLRTIGMFARNECNFGQAVRGLR